MMNKKIITVKSIYFILIFCSFSFLIFFLFLNQFSNREANENQKTREQLAPTFNTKTIKGEEFSLQFNNSNSTIITFWASWCPPCRKELPILDEINNENMNVRIIGVNIDGDIRDAEKFVNQYNISFMSVIDEDFITIKYGVSKIPETFFIDQNGQIISRVSGNLTKDKIKKLIPRSSD